MWEQVAVIFPPIIMKIIIVTMMIVMTVKIKVTKRSPFFRPSPLSNYNDDSDDYCDEKPDVDVTGKQVGSKEELM